MNNNESNSLADGLLKRTAYPHPVDKIECIETHISWVILTGTFAYKIKKPVNFGFLDFSTLEKRKYCCQEEVRLNRRLAKEWYLDAVPVTGSIDSPKINGDGNVIDYAVLMRQFPSAQTLRQSAASNRLLASDIDEISRIVAEFHQIVANADSRSSYGESRDIRHWFDDNIRHIKPLLSDTDEKLRIDTLEGWGERELSAKRRCMQTRKASGFIRECHGDLHTGNMTKIEDRIVLFDCIEFNPMLRWIDVFSDIAFIVMDLWQLGYANFAFRFLNRYLEKTGDYEGLALLRYYLVYRALVRAKVALLRKTQESDELAQEQASNEYRQCAELADRISRDTAVRLFITHGFSGAGKSTFANALAEKIGGIHLRSDIERKRLFGYTAQASTRSGLKTGIYTADSTENTYRRLAELTESILEAKFSVIVDATFLKAGQRDMFRRIAADRKIPFTLLDFQAPDDILRQRIEQRSGDPSEATAGVLDNQRTTAELLTHEETISAFQATGNLDESIARLIERLDSR